MRCSICCELFTPPIRMLLCGHSFCEKCLRPLFESSMKSRCPICRKDAEKGCSVRNFDLERTMNRIKINANERKKIFGAIRSTDNLVGEALRLTEANNFDPALRLIERLFVFTDDINCKFVLSVLKIRCHFGCNDIESTQNEIKSLFELVNNETINYQKLLSIYSDFDRDLLNISFTFPKYNKQTIDLVISSVIKMTFSCYHKRTDMLLYKLSSIASHILLIPEKYSDDALGTTRPDPNLLKDIVSKLQSIEKVNLVAKNREVAHVLIKYGDLLRGTFIKLENHSQASSAYEQAIGILETTCRKEAEETGLLAECYCKLAKAQESCLHFAEAQRAYRKAKDISTKLNQDHNTDDLQFAILRSSLLGIMLWVWIIGAVFFGIFIGGFK